jgi:hypothetical protein
MLMQALDLFFNIFPAEYPHGFPFKSSLHPHGIGGQWILLELGCFAFMGGFLAWIFLKNFASHPPYPQRDPRVLEAMGVAAEPEEMPDSLPDR